MNDGECVHIYNANGEHVGTLTCSCLLCDGIDLCLPDGKVLFCGVDKHLAKTLGDLLKVEHLADFYAD